MLLKSNGQTIAVLKVPFIWPTGDYSFDVSTGGSNLFGMRGDFFGGPEFVHPFGDGKKFLCIYDNDTAMLAFVVDFTGSVPNTSISEWWPQDGYCRGCLVRESTNVAFTTSGDIRMPALSEVREISDELKKMPRKQFLAESLPSLDLGFYRYYLPKDWILRQLDTNRTSVWPTR